MNISHNQLSSHLKILINSNRTLLLKLIFDLMEDSYHSFLCVTASISWDGGS